MVSGPLSSFGADIRALRAPDVLPELTDVEALFVCAGTMPMDLRRRAPSALVVLAMADLEATLADSSGAVPAVAADIVIGSRGEMEGDDISAAMRSGARWGAAAVGSLRSFPPSWIDVFGGVGLRAEAPACAEAPAGDG